MLTKKQIVEPLPSPIVVAASQDWDGNDGPWSSFTLQVGTPAQNVKVLISTSGFQTWAVVSQGCTSTDPPDCAKSRGNLFVPSKSISWNYVGANSTFTLDSENNLGYSGNGLFGYDTIALDWQGSGGPTLDQRLVAGIATKEYYLGMFGLDPRPTNLTDFNHPIPSYLATLRNQSKIPSLAWGYTAGNQYRLQQVLGSLTLGGYDASRFVSNPLTFPLNQIDARALTVIIQKITFDATDHSAILLDKDNDVAALIDSTAPYIYLPQQVCEKFEIAFGITWNDTVQAYLVNETLHTILGKQNATVSFSLGTSAGSETINITLPYAAFDLTASYPLLTNKSRYFPLVRAENASQYTLGRTFLQEAYLTVDYERRNFSVSQCDWNSLGQQDIRSIISPTYALSNRSTPAHEFSQHRLSGGQISGIVIGSVVLTILLSLLALKSGLIRAFIRPENLIEDHKAELECHDVKTEDQPRQLIDGEPYFGPELGADKVEELLCDGLQHELAARHQNSELATSPSVLELPTEDPPAEMLGDEPPSELPTSKMH